MVLDFARIETACRDNLEAIAESLNLCFDSRLSIECGPPADWGDAPAAMATAGVAVEMRTADGAVVGLIPESLPLPAWYRSPDESQKSRLRTLAAEWSFLALPEDLECDHSDARAVENLAAAVSGADPVPESAFLKFSVIGTEGHCFWIMATAKASPFPPEVTEQALMKPVEATRPVEAAVDASPSPAPADSGVSDLRRRRLGRVLHVPVQVVVHLAEKKIEMGQLLSIAPGSLIAFDKNCEDLLDLYVNNRLYCRGEAVKIGENFGLKINELGAVKQRVERVL